MAIGPIAKAIADWGVKKAATTPLFSSKSHGLFKLKVRSQITDKSTSIDLSTAATKKESVKQVGPRKAKQDTSLGKPKMLRKPRIAAEDLLKRTVLDRREKSRDVAITKVERISPPKQLTDWEGGFRVRTYNKENYHKYICHVFCEDANVTPSSKVVVQCSCADYIYTWEVANAEKGGCAFVWRSNGEAPDMKNPTRKISLCKHSYLALRYLLKHKWPNP